MFRFLYLVWPKMFPKNKIGASKPGTTKDGNPTATGGATGGDEHRMPRKSSIRMDANNRVTTIKKKPAKVEAVNPPELTDSKKILAIEGKGKTPKGNTTSKKSDARLDTRSKSSSFKPKAENVKGADAPMLTASKILSSEEGRGLTLKELAEIGKQRRAKKKAEEEAAAGGGGM